MKKHNSKSMATLLAGVAGLALASAAFGQAEVEPNDTKATPNDAFGASGTGMVSGDTITGNTTGTSTTAPGAASADNFRVKTAAAPLGIYRHRLAITTSGTAGHTGTIRGASATNTGDVAAQTSSSATTPARFNQWYGFGKGEEIIYRVTGGTTTTGDYTATLETTPVVPIEVATVFQTGPITISTIGQTTVDTDFWVYDANFDPVPTFGNDDNTVAGGGTGTGLQSLATRTLTAGTYYIAVSRYNVQNNQLSPSDERGADPILDAANALCGSSSTTNGNVSLTITGTAGSTPVALTQAGPFDVVWVRFVVGADGQLFGVGSVTPGTVAATPLTPQGGVTSTLLTVQVTPGTNPPSTGISVTADLTNLGLIGPAALFDDGTNGDATPGDNIFSRTVTPASTTQVGNVAIPFTVTDAQSGTFTGNITLRVLPPLVDIGAVDAANEGLRVDDLQVFSSSVRWVRFTTACETNAANSEFFDIFTDTTGSLADTEIGLYASDGTLIASDDDSGTGVKSLLTFGTGSGVLFDTFPANGNDGAILPAGTYFLAIGDFDTIFSSSFGITANGLDAGTVDLTFDTNLTCGPTCNDIDFNNDGIEQDPTDIEAFLSVYSGGGCIPVENVCDGLDFNNDGIEQDPTDIEAFLSVYSGGPCF